MPSFDLYEARALPIINNTQEIERVLNIGV
jgi:hypothetical protein